MCTRFPSRGSSDGGLPLSDALVRAGVGGSLSASASVLASEDAAEMSTCGKLCSASGSVGFVSLSTSLVVVGARTAALL